MVMKMRAPRCRSLLQSLQVKTESSQKNIFFNSEFALTNSTLSCINVCLTVEWYIILRF